jgi:hypothetical protein
MRRIVGTLLAVGALTGLVAYKAPRLKELMETLS